MEQRCFLLGFFVVWMGFLSDLSGAANAPALVAMEEDEPVLYAGPASFIPETHQSLELGFVRDVLSAPSKTFKAGERTFEILGVCAGEYEYQFNNSAHQTLLAFVWELDGWRYTRGVSHGAPHEIAQGYIDLLFYEKVSPVHMGPVHVGHVLP